MGKLQGARLSLCVSVSVFNHRVTQRNIEGHRVFKRIIELYWREPKKNPSL